MANIALLTAAGSGTRMGQDIPKQFLNVNDRPVIVYTLQAFQQHPDIDEIAVVCIDGWQQVLWAYAKQFNITKLKLVVEGGENGQASIRNGVMELVKQYSDDDIVLVHDAIRPNVSQEIISGCIATCRLKGSAIAVIACAEAMLLRKGEDEDSSVSDKIIPVWHRNRGIEDFRRMCEKYSGKIVAITGFKNDICENQFLMFLKLLIYGMMVIK